MTTLGVGVVGLGVGEHHARTYHRLPSCEVRWLYDYDATRAKTLARELGSAQAAASFTHMLDDPAVDVISIASFDDDHYGHVVAALNAGKHVFAEKPLCRKMEELADIREAWVQHDGRVKLASNLILRAAPLYRWLKAQLDEGTFGEVYAIDGEYLYGRLHKITDGWRKDVEDYSVMLGGGIHLADLMLWLLDRRPDIVMAAGNNIGTRGSDFGYNDFTTAVMSFSSSGMIGRLTANFGCVHRHQHVLRIYGTKGTFLYDDAGPRLHLSRDPEAEPQSILHAPLPANKGNLIPEFVSTVFSDEDYTAQTQIFFDGISVCVACDRAQSLQSPVEVTYV